jgi:hypothetical protein
VLGLKPNSAIVLVHEIHAVSGEEARGGRGAVCGACSWAWVNRVGGVSD